MNRQLLISYAIAFVSFLMRQPEMKPSTIKSVYLFGSVARGDFDKESDVDIFIDVEKNHEILVSKIIKKAIKNFLNSAEYRKFAILGVKNEINAKCGYLKEWELYNSVKSEALVLFSSSVFPFFKKYFLVEVKPISDTTKRNKIIRRLAGRKEKDRKEKGLISALGGTVLDSRHYIVPADMINNILSIFAKEKVFYEIREVWM